MVAIILVNYNGYQDTIDCIKSIKKHTKIENEIIVVDNFSTDKSLEKLQEFKKKQNFTLLEAEENKGFSAGNNIGLKYALEKDMDYYLLLNNDTIVEEQFLERLLAPFEKNKDIVTTPKILYYSDKDKVWYNGGSISNITARTIHFDFNETNFNKTDSNLTKVTFASGCCLCLSRDVLLKVGLLNEDFFLYEEDAEFCRRLLKNKIDILYVSNSIIYHKVSSSTGVGSPLSQYYSVRNKYYLIRTSYSGINKLISYVYCTCQFLYRCIKKELNFKYYISGLKAFIKKEIGKKEVDVS